MNHNLQNLKLARNIGTLALSALMLTGTTALANITQSGTTDTSPSAGPQVHEILDRASFVAFEAASTLQQEEDSTDREKTAEQLKGYMAAMIYEPKAVLPSDADALDEPWVASNSGLLDEDGMVVPHLEDDTSANPLKKLKVPATISKKPFLKLLKPVQNALVTSPFGLRWGRPHQGIDLAAPVGTPIISAEAGKVVYSGWKQGYGNFVAVDHGHGFITHYAHCSKLLVRCGQAVAKGEQIAKVGNTGHSTGPHLHFEVLANGVHRNPAKFLNTTTVVVQAH